MKSEGNAKGLLMKVICNRGALLEALTVAGSVAAARTPKPILQCVKLSASGNELTVSATDLEVAIRYRDNQVEVTAAASIHAAAGAHLGQARPGPATRRWGRDWDRP